MTTLQILKAVRGLLTLPEAWTTGELARDSCGRMVGPGSPMAVCWCLNGAMQRCGSDEYERCAVRNLLRETKIGASARGAFSEWQDAPERTHADLLELLDQGIELALARA